MLVDLVVEVARVFVVVLDGQALRDVGRLAFVEHHHASRTHVEQRPVVGREEHGRARLVDVLEQPEDVDGELRIEVARRLVGQDERWLADDGARHGDALLFAAAEHLRPIVAATCEPDALERLADTSADEPMRQPHHLEGDGDVVEHGPAGDELEVLEDEPDVPAQSRDRVVGEPGDVATQEQDASIVDTLGSMHEPQQGALAGARRPRDEHELAALDRERHATEHRLVGSVRLVDVLEDEDRPPRGRRVVAMPLSQRLSKRPVGGGRGHRPSPISHAEPGKLFGPRRVRPGRSDLLDETSALAHSASVRVAFFGLPLGALLLEHDGHDIVLAAVSRTDAVGLRRLKRRLGDRVVVKPRTDAALLARVRRLAPDLLASWFWTKRLPMELVAAARLGGVGVHPSLLPRHRGPDPTYWAIASGDEVSGVTAHRLERDYDTGAVLAQERLAIDPEWNAWQLARALDRPSLRVLRRVVARYACGEAVAEQTQDEALATAAPFPTEDETWIQWSWPTARVLRHVRALAPAPGAVTEVAGALVTVLRARDEPAIPRVLLPGEGAVIGGAAVVRTLDGGVRLLEGIVHGEAGFERAQKAHEAHEAHEAQGAEEDRVPAGPAELAALFIQRRTLVVG